MKIIIDAVGPNPAIVVDIIKEICDFKGFDFDTIIKKINEGKSEDFCGLPENKAREWHERLVLAGAAVELDKDTFLERLFDMIFTPIGKVLEWEVDLYHKSKALGIVLFVIEAIALVVLVVKCWQIILALVVVLAFVDIYNDKRRHTDEERRETTDMFKKMGICLAIIVAVVALINFIADRYNSTDVAHDSYFENFSTDTAIRKTDKALCGRWRSADGGVIELSDTGDAQTSLDLRPWWAIGKSTALSWEASNGQLELITSYAAEYDYKYYPKDWGDEYMADHLRVDSLTLHRVNGNTGDSMIGVWDDNDMGGPYFTFNEDGTGAFADDKYTTWEADDERVYIYYDLYSTFDYSVEGDLLTIFFSDGSDIYTRIGY